MESLKSEGAFTDHTKEETTGIHVILYKSLNNLGGRSGKTEGISKIYHRS